jgi:hypothetical protein
MTGMEIPNNSNIQCPINNEITQKVKAYIVIFLMAFFLSSSGSFDKYGLTINADPIGFTTGNKATIPIKSK